MTPSPPDLMSVHGRGWAWARLVLSAFAAATMIQAMRLEPWLALPLAVFGSMILVPQLLARKRLRRLLTSGNVSQILAVWSDAVASLPHHRTLGPLVRATAWAAHGQTEQARSALGRAERGQAWERAIDHRLFVETLIEAFEGRPQRALDKARALHSLPLPGSPWVRYRAQVLRNSASALARAFAHCSEPADAKRLQAAAKHHPLVHWAMNYALAVIRIDRGERKGALAAIAQAPRWPQGSTFESFHAELIEHAKSPPAAAAE